MNYEFNTAQNLAKSLFSPNCVAWENLYEFMLNNGKEITLKVIENERQGTNYIYNLHLDLAAKAVNQSN